MKKLIFVLPFVMSLLVAYGDGVDPELRKWCDKEKPDMPKEGLVCLNNFVKTFPKSNAVELIEDFFNSWKELTPVFESRDMLRHIKKNDITIQNAEKAGKDFFVCFEEIMDKQEEEESKFTVKAIAKCEKDISDNISEHCPDPRLWNANDFANGLKQCKDEYIRYCVAKQDAKEKNKNIETCNIALLGDTAKAVSPNELAIKRTHNPNTVSNEEAVQLFKKFSKILSYKNLCDFDEKEVEILATSYGIDLNGEKKATPKAEYIKTPEIEPKKSNAKPSRLGEIVELN